MLPLLLMEARFDWCVVTLQNDLGTNNGWFGVGTTNGSLKGTSVTISRYPGETAGKAGFQYRHSGTILSSAVYTVNYIIDTEGGQSGSPVYDSDYIAWAIHTTGGIYANSGVRFTSDLFNIVKDKIGN